MLQLLLPVHVIVQYVLRDLLLAQHLHQQILLYIVRAEAVDAPLHRCTLLAVEHEAVLVGNVLDVV